MLPARAGLQIARETGHVRRTVKKYLSIDTASLPPDVACKPKERLIACPDLQSLFGVLG